MSNWFHVCGVDNSADVISRGCCPSKLSNLSLWWHGPSWLLKHNNEWPDTTDEGFDSNKECVDRKIKPISAICTVASDINIINRYSSFGKLLRIVAYCLRFKNNCLRNEFKSAGSLSAEEIKIAKMYLIKLVQEDEFFIK